MCNLCKLSYKDIMHNTYMYQLLVNISYIRLPHRSKFLLSICYIKLLFLPALAVQEFPCKDLTKISEKVRILLQSLLFKQKNAVTVYISTKCKSLCTRTLTLKSYI